MTGERGGGRDNEEGAVCRLKGSCFVFNVVNMRLLPCRVFSLIARG